MDMLGKKQRFNTKTDFFSTELKKILNQLIFSQEFIM